MTGHSRWLVPDWPSVANINYVQGYILACEDILSDIGALDERYKHPNIADVVEAVKRALAEADTTLKSLQAKM